MGEGKGRGKEKGREKGRKRKKKKNIAFLTLCIEHTSNKKKNIWKKKN